MEASRHIELERFAKKADGYRAALQSSPRARSLELMVVASLLRGHCKRRGWDLEDMRVVDLMAGSGYLGSFLEEVGFRHVWAIEACEEMRKSSAQSSGMRRIAMTDWTQLATYLGEIQPHFVVSLAGLHHLIQHEGRKISRAGSITWQFEVMNECLRQIPEDGLMVVVDLVELGASGIPGVSTFRGWDGSTFRSTGGLPASLGEKLSTTESFEDYEECVTGVFSGSRENPTLRWFREVVDQETVVGHDDVALSRDLLRLLMVGNEVSFFPFSCPWIFGSTEELKYFLLHKFGFLVDRKPGEVDEGRVLELAAATNGLTELGNGRVGFGWNLAALGIPGRRSSWRPQVFARMNSSVVVLLIILIVRLVLKASSYQAFSSIQGFIDTVVGIVGGVGISGALELFVKGRKAEGHVT